MILDWRRSGPGDTSDRLLSQLGLLVYKVNLELHNANQTDNSYKDNYEKFLPQKKVMQRKRESFSLNDEIGNSGLLWQHVRPVYA